MSIHVNVTDNFGSRDVAANFKLNIRKIFHVGDMLEISKRAVGKPVVWLLCPVDLLDQHEYSITHSAR